MSQPSIADYLGDDGGFSVALWTTYSINFPSAYFIHKQHILPLIGTGTCHMLADSSKLDEACIDDEQLSKFEKLQKNVFLSPAKVPGTFHPKLILLAGETKLRLILTSGNATAAGLLSNIDLITRYDYDSKSETPDPYSMGIIAGGFNFARTLPGWHQDALYKLDKVAELHPFLISTDHPMFLSSLANRSLFDQMKDSVGRQDIREIEIYSPFFDPKLEALSRFSASFPKAKITAYAGLQEVELADPSLAKKLSEKKLQLFSAQCLKKSLFHAKLYRFIHKNDSIVFWGSANCSAAALLAPKYNVEFLVRCELTEDQFTTLFARSRLPPVAPQFTAPIKKPNAANDQDTITLESAEVVSGELRVVSREPMANNVLNAVGRDGYRYFAIKSDVGANHTIDLNLLKITPLAVELLDANGNRISNRIPVILTDIVLATASAGSQTDIRDDIRRNRSSALAKIDALCVFEDMESSGKPDSSSPSQRAPDYWNSVSGNRSHLWSSGYALRSGKQDQTENTNIPTDEDDPDAEPTADNEPKKKALLPEDESPFEPIRYLYRRVSRQYRKLRDCVLEGIKPRDRKWAQAVEHWINFALRNFQNHGLTLDDDDVYLCVQLFSCLAHMSAFFAAKVDLAQVAEESESSQARILTYSEAALFFSFFVHYDNGVFMRLNDYWDLKEANPDSIEYQSRARFLLGWFDASLPASLNQSWRERINDLSLVTNALLYDDVVAKVLKALRQRPQPKVFRLPLQEAKNDVLFVHPSLGPVYLESINGLNGSVVGTLERVIKVRIDYLTKIPQAKPQAAKP